MEHVGASGPRTPLLPVSRSGATEALDTSRRLSLVGSDRCVARRNLMENAFQSPFSFDSSILRAHVNLTLRRPDPALFPRRMERLWAEKAKHRAPTCASKMEIIVSSSMRHGVARVKLAVIQITTWSSGRHHGRVIRSSISDSHWNRPNERCRATHPRSVIRRLSQDSHLQHGDQRSVSSHKLVGGRRRRLSEPSRHFEPI
jgi:hypothetical protein